MGQGPEWAAMRVAECLAASVGERPGVPVGEWVAALVLEQAAVWIQGWMAVKQARTVSA